MRITCYQTFATGADKSNIWYRQKMKNPWKQGMIIQVGPQPRSYIIQGNDGTVYRRHRVFIRPDNARSDSGVGSVIYSTVDHELGYTVWNIWLFDAACYRAASK